MSLPVYVGCSIDPRALELAAEEEMEGLSKLVEVIMDRWEKTKNQSKITG
jgi:hypothetical protein